MDSGDSTPNFVDGDEIKRERNGRKYNILTREYLAQGHDGYVALMGSKHVMDDEVGQMFSTLVRQYLLVSRQTRLLTCKQNIDGPFDDVIPGIAIRQ